MLPRSAETDAFWQAFRRHLELDRDNYVVGSFGDTRRYRPNRPIWSSPGLRRPQPAWHAITGRVASRHRDFVIMLDGQKRPRFIWRTTEVTIKPLSQVDEAFAWDEGEGDSTQDWWLDAHRRYFARQASRERLKLEDDIVAVFERFEVVWPLDLAAIITAPKSDGKD